MIAITRWKYDPEPLSPITILVHMKIPIKQMNAVYIMDFASIGVWWYPEVKLLKNEELKEGRKELNIKLS